MTGHRLQMLRFAAAGLGTAFFGFADEAIAESGWRETGSDATHERDRPPGQLARIALVGLAVGDQSGQPIADMSLPDGQSPIEEGPQGGHPIIMAGEDQQ